MAVVVLLSLSLIYIWRHVFLAYAIKLSGGLSSTASSRRFSCSLVEEEVTRAGFSSSFEIKFCFSAGQ